MLIALFPSFVGKLERFLCVFKYSILIGQEKWRILVYYSFYLVTPVATPDRSLCLPGKWEQLILSAQKPKKIKPRYIFRPVEGSLKRKGH